jgi:hypothetical protein
MKSFTIVELTILIVLVVFALALPATCGPKVRGQCTPPQYRNTLQHDIHRDDPCEDKE